MYYYAVTKAVELIGEAASHVTAEVRGLYPEIEWVQIIGMRNRLAHVLHDIDRDTLWNVIQDHVPALIPRLEQAIHGQSK